MSGSRLGVVVQSRVGSTRLPGKVLRPLDGTPMIAWCLERLRRLDAAWPVILATGDGADNDPLADLAASMGYAVFRGDETDVLDRYLRCAEAHRLDHVVRATGDNPFVDVTEGRRLAMAHLAAGNDYTENVTAGLPIGLGLEVFATEALARSAREGLAPHHREHVNEYILENPALFLRATLPPLPGRAAPGLSFTVDTPEQFARAETLARAARAEGSEIDAGWLISRAARKSEEGNLAP